MDKQRYEKEIEEILSKYDQGAPPKEKKPREEKPVRDPINFRPSSPAGRPRPASTPRFNWKRLSAGQYIALAFGVALLSIVVRPFPWLASIMVLLAAVLFLVPILLYHSTGTTSGGYSPTEEKRWRGQPIDLNTRREINNDPLEAIKRWFRRR